MPDHARRTSEPVDGFRLAYDDGGAGPAVVLLHGWPGDRGDYHRLAPRLTGHARVVTPDLRGFGESDKHNVDTADDFAAAAQARSVAGLIRELDVGPVVLAGYDVGSRVAQTLARTDPDLVRAMVLAPPMPGAGRRVLEPGSQREFWYQQFHQLDLVEELIDGSTSAVRSYLAHFWRHWSGPDFVLDDEHLTRLVEVYSAPGAFLASIAWYRAGAGMVSQSVRERAPDPDDRLATPLTVLWPEHDPLFPRPWSDRLAEFFSDVTMVPVDGVGHFAPLEYPEVMAEAILAALR